jgi:hypothetical protein
MDFDAIVKAFAEFLRQQQGMGQPFQGLEAQPSQQEAPEATMAETAATPSMLAQTFGMQAPAQNLFAQAMPGMAQPAINSIRSQPPVKQPQQSGPVFQAASRPINSIRSQPPVKQPMPSRPMGAFAGGMTSSTAQPQQPITNIRTPAGGGMFRGLPVRGMASRLTRIF